jgi:hypothetical protein
VVSGGGAGGDVVGARTRTMEGAVAEKFRRLGMYRVVSGAPRDDVGAGLYRTLCRVPPLQARGVYDLFGKVLSRPPRIAMRSRTAMRRMERPERGSRVLPAALVPSVHFHFAAENDHETRVCGNEDDAAGRRVGRSSAFHRILLHSVCQFHGLESSSSVVRPSRRGGRRGTAAINSPGGTVMGGRRREGDDGTGGRAPGTRP